MSSSFNSTSTSVLLDVEILTESGSDKSLRAEMILAFMSADALLVKVMARMWRKFRASSLESAIFRYSFTRVKVLPEPAEDL